jgi:hypothetical protein
MNAFSVMLRRTRSERKRTSERKQRVVAMIQNKQEKKLPETKNDDEDKDRQTRLLVLFVFFVYLFFGKDLPKSLCCSIFSFSAFGEIPGS